MSRITLYNNDCLVQLKELKDNSIDSIVTDPPYGLAFMNKKWDYDVPAQEIWEQCLRVLKPGGHLLSFAGSRTYHRMAVRIEDAGFEIRDQIMWLYGSGFPKSLNIGKAVDKLQGNKRQIIGKSKNDRPKSKLKGGMGFDRSLDNGQKHQPIIETKDTSEWEGWGTALKPAHEPIVMARKPISEKSVAQNVLEHGTGGINIDESRIDISDNDDIFSTNPHTKGGFGHNNASIYGKSKGAELYDPSKGRFPANIILDKEAGKVLDEQSGEITSETLKKGASRFFYCAKSSKKDREEGNNHPTVKPTDLMLYLIRLVTPKGGTTLDPFMGSGSTGKAAMQGEFSFIGIEREKEYFEIAKSRIKEPNNLNKFMGDE
jgi:DNA modification methylase